MTQSITIVPCIRAIASAVPEPHWSTDELLEPARDRLSAKLVGKIGERGADNRHSVLANSPPCFSMVPNLNSAFGLPAQLSRRYGAVSTRRVYDFPVLADAFALMALSAARGA